VGWDWLDIVNRSCMYIVRQIAISRIVVLMRDRVKKIRRGLCLRIRGRME
jgi:hypothetical protein